ncbi:MAG: DUF58 domain-containing protein [Actinobacteria bacterium]|nr:MAG: DUF58 domain-containing protein [Actinomycetota bacterium]
MPTRRGWLLGVGSIVSMLAGRLVGMVELYVLGAAGIALTIGAVVYVRALRCQLEVARTLHPARVHAGGTSLVQLAVRNVAWRRSPTLVASDPFDGGKRVARFLVPPLGSSDSGRAAYRVPTEQRGVFGLGPLALQLSDPFRLASLWLTGAPATRLVVYPRIDKVPAPPHTQGDDPRAGADHRSFLSRTGEDFYALRAYQVGDDLRRVHWPSTARLDDLMIRQEEMPWQGRASVLLDLRKSVYTPDSLEVAVSAAASIVSSVSPGHALVRLLATDGTDTGFAAGRAHVEAVLERLAEVRMTSSGSLVNELGVLSRAAGGGVLVVVTTARASETDLERIARLRSSFPTVMAVLIEEAARATTVAPGVARRPTPGSVIPVRVTPTRPFATAWTEALGRDRRLLTTAGGQW